MLKLIKFLTIRSSNPGRLGIKPSATAILAAKLPEPSSGKGILKRYLTTTQYVFNQKRDNNKKDLPIIRFKEDGMKLKETFKEFYSLYGPLFLVCHIGISLISLALFTVLVYYAVDITSYIPTAIVMKLGEKGALLTGEGSKFIAAYAAYKAIFPLRVIASAGLTKYLAPKVKWGRKKDGQQQQQHPA